MRFWASILRVETCWSWFRGRFFRPDMTVSARHSFHVFRETLSKNVKSSFVSLASSDHRHKLSPGGMSNSATVHRTGISRQALCVASLGTLLSLATGDKCGTRLPPKLFC